MKFFVRAAVLSTALVFGGTARALTVGLIADFQSELGCPGDFVPDCPGTQLSAPTFDTVWRETFGLPAGSWSYKIALDGGFAQTFPIANVALSVGAAQDVRFYYDAANDFVADNVNNLIPVLASDFQSELGCSGDFTPDCLRSWLIDSDGDGIYTFATTLPIGTYSTIVAMNEGFAETYGAGGVPGGPNIGFQVTDPNSEVQFFFNGNTKVLRVAISSDLTPVPLPATFPIFLIGLAMLIPFVRRARAQ